LFVPENAVQTVVSITTALILLATAERLLGTARATLAFLVTGVLGIALGVLGQWSAANTGELLTHTTESGVTLDPTVGIVGALIAASAFANTLWRRRIRLLTFAFILMLALYNSDQNNVYRLIAALLGLALGAILRGGRIQRIRRSSHGETRTLVAALIGLTALGPLAALLPPGGFGSFSFIAAQGFGPALLSLLPLALLLVTAIGLRRGRHFALLLGIVVDIALIVLPFAAIPGGSLSADIDGYAALAPVAAVLLWLFAVLLPPLASLVLLIATRRQFQIRAPRDAVVRFTLLSVISFALLAVAYLVAGLATLSSYVPEAGLGDVFASMLRRFVPAGLESALGPVVVPTAPIVLSLSHWVGPVFWSVFVLGVLRLYRATSTGRTAGDELRFRELLRWGGGGTLGFRGTWPGNVYWFSEEGDAAIAYRVIDGVAITLSDPVCRPEHAERAIIDFVAFCDANSWTPAFYSRRILVVVATRRLAGR
jgi:lysylphosphatidylglycerol synthetase-like protein (DUF2156 family)